MRIGFFGGTFNPIHFGHLSLAIEMKEIHHLDEIWICPASLSPFKIDHKIMDPKHRLRMVELATEDLPFVKVLNYEIEQQCVCYTIDTLRYLAKESPPNLQLFLIIGEDAIPTLSKWKNSTELIQSFPPLIGRRSLTEPESISNNPILTKAIQEGYTKTSIMEISATQIRKRLLEGLYCGHLVPSKVINYIQKHQLYK